MELTRIPLKPEDQAALVALRTKQAALETFVQYTVGEGQRRTQALMEENAKTWDGVARNYGLDTNKVEYVLSEDGKELVPARVRL